MARIEISKESHELVKSAAAKKNKPITSYVDNILKKFHAQEGDTKVILTVPTNLSNNKLGEWCESVKNSLIKALKKE